MHWKMEELPLEPYEDGYRSDARSFIRVLDFRPLHSCSISYPRHQLRSNNLSHAPGIERAWRPSVEKLRRYRWSLGSQLAGVPVFFPDPDSRFVAGGACSDHRQSGDISRAI